MTWYLTIRALCVLSFVATVFCLFGAGIAVEEHRGTARTWTLSVLAFAVTGCLLIGLGWTPEHP